MISFTSHCPRRWILLFIMCNFFFRVADAAFSMSGLSSNFLNLYTRPRTKLSAGNSQAFGTMKSLDWLCLSSYSTSSLFAKQPSQSFQERLSDKDQPTSSGSSDSLSDLLSSTERYAVSLNMTLEQLQHQKEIYQNASEELQERLERMDKDEAGLSPSATSVGKQKHEMICEHRLKHGRHPFVCSKCWSYLPVCVCHLADAPSTREEHEKSKMQWDFPNSNLQLLVWTHHREWGLTSNTGSILALTLGNDASNRDSTYIDTSSVDTNNPCRLLMKGLPKHDQILQGILDSAGRDQCHHGDDGSTLVVVLWPSSNPENTITLQQLRQELEASSASSSSGAGSTNKNPQVSDAKTSSPQRKRKVLLLAVDGTWRNARRMVAKLPSYVKRLDLDESAIRWNDDLLDGETNRSEDSLSILAPLRKRGLSGKDNHKVIATANASPLDNEKRQVCTAEAVVAALHALGAIDTGLAQHVLYVTQTKVDRVRRYRGKVQ